LIDATNNHAQPHTISAREWPAGLAIDQKPAMRHGNTCCHSAPKVQRMHPTNTVDACLVLAIGFKTLFCTLFVCVFVVV
jgi:hypothetical protein